MSLILLSLGCGKSRGSKGTPVVTGQASGNDSTSPNSSTTINSGDVLSNQGYLGSNNGTLSNNGMLPQTDPGILGNYQNQQQQIQMQQMYEQYQEQNSFGNIAIRSLPTLLGGFLGGGINPLGSLLGGIGGMTTGGNTGVGNPSTLNPNLLAQQQTLYPNSQQIMSTPGNIVPNQQNMIPQNQQQGTFPTPNSTTMNITPQVLLPGFSGLMAQ